MANDFDSRGSRRFRLTVPADDVAVIEWLERQHSVSMSVRMLVRRAIAEGGMRDYFATESDEIVQRPRRGRPAGKTQPKAVDAPTDSAVEEKSETPEPAPRAEETHAVPARPVPDIGSKLDAMGGFFS